MSNKGDLFDQDRLKGNAPSLWDGVISRQELMTLIGIGKSQAQRDLTQLCNEEIPVKVGFVTKTDRNKPHLLFEKTTEKVDQPDPLPHVKLLVVEVAPPQPVPD